MSIMPPFTNPNLSPYNHGVDCFVSGYAVSAYDVLLEQFFDWRRAHIGEQLSFYLFWKLLHRYYYEGVIALCWGQLFDDVDAPPLQGPRWHD
jgi:hypothetical protein